MKISIPLRFLLLTSVFLSTTSLVEARGKPIKSEGYSSDQARNIRSARDKEAKRRQENYKNYRNNNSHYYRSGYSYYPGYRYGGYNRGYYYGYPRTTIAIGVAPVYSTQYVERERPVYRGEVLRESSASLEISVQKKLGKLGYYEGAYDGDIGPASRRAILKYQRDNDLSETGRIDRDLVDSLGLS